MRSWLFILLTSNICLNGIKHVLIKIRCTFLFVGHPYLLKYNCYYFKFNFIFEFSLLFLPQYRIILLPLWFVWVGLCVVDTLMYLNIWLFSFHCKDGWRLGGCASCCWNPRDQTLWQMEHRRCADQWHLTAGVFDTFTQLDINMTWTWFCKDCIYVFYLPLTL